MNLHQKEEIGILINELKYPMNDSYISLTVVYLKS